MSKRSLFWGNASGKLGEAVLYRAGGEQRARAWVAKIKNPKTRAQMVNRVSMANFAAFYRATKAFLAYSFTDRKVGQSGFNALLHANKSSVSPAIDPVAARRGLSVPNRFVISTGLVPGMQASVLSASDLSAVTTGFVGAAGTAGDASLAVATSVDAVKAAIFAALGNDIRLQNLPNVFKINVILAGYADEGYRPSLHSITVDKSSIADYSTATATMLKVEGNLAATADGISPFGVATLENGAQALVVGVGGEEAGNGSYFVGYFVSYSDESSRLQVSNGQMLLIGDDSYLAQFLPNGSVYEDVLASLGVGLSDTLSTVGTNVDDSSSEVGNVPAVTSVTVGGVALGGEVAGTGTKSIVINGRAFDEAAPTLTIDGKDVTVTVSSSTRATASYNFQSAKSYAIVATAGSSTRSGNITVTSTGSGESNPL